MIEHNIFENRGDKSYENIYIHILFFFLFSLFLGFFGRGFYMLGDGSSLARIIFIISVFIISLAYTLFHFFFISTFPRWLRAALLYTFLIITPLVLESIDIFWRWMAGGINQYEAYSLKIFYPYMTGLALFSVLIFIWLYRGIEKSIAEGRSAWWLFLRTAIFSIFLLFFGSVIALIFTVRTGDGAGGLGIISAFFTYLLQGFLYAFIGNTIGYFVIIRKVARYREQNSDFPQK